MDEFRTLTLTLRRPVTLADIDDTDPENPTYKDGATVPTGTTVTFGVENDVVMASSSFVVDGPLEGWVDNETEVMLATAEEPCPFLRSDRSEDGDEYFECHGSIDIEAEAVSLCRGDIRKCPVSCARGDARREVEARAAKTTIKG